MRELLRPPPHRGPLIAAGAVVLALGVALAELRLAGELSAGAHVLLLAVPAALILALGIQAPNEDGRPPAYQSVLLVTGLLLAYGALLRAADALGADGLGGAGALTWTSALLAAGAALIAATRRAAVCALIAALAGGIAVIAALYWIADPVTFTAARWILLALALALVLLGLRLRAVAPRHAELLIVAAGLATLAIGLQSLAGAALTTFAFGLSAGILPGVFELVLLGAGCGLVAYGAVDRAPGPAWVGFANLVAFVGATAVGDATLRWWPLVLVLLGGGALAAGLRPRAPLPPEPDAYRAGDRPLASRTADDEILVRVRDEGRARPDSVSDR